MTITLADTRFSGPYSRFDFLDHRPGVWAVMDGRELPPVAAGAGEDVHDLLADHPDRERWTEECQRPSVAVFYSRQRSRRERILEDMLGCYGLRPVGIADPAGTAPASDPPPVPSERPDRSQDGPLPDTSERVRAVS